MAVASARREEPGGQDLAHTLIISPLASLATTAIAELESEIAASTLSFIQPNGGGFHWGTRVAVSVLKSTGSGLTMVCLILFAKRAISSLLILRLRLLDGGVLVLGIEEGGNCE